MGWLENWEKKEKRRAAGRKAANTKRKQGPNRLSEIASKAAQTKLRRTGGRNTYGGHPRETD